MNETPPGTPQTRLLTPTITFGSLFLLLVISGGCAHDAVGEPPTTGSAHTETADPAPAPAVANADDRPAAAAREVSLGVPDTGIWSDLDDKIQIDLPAGIEASRVTATVDTAHSLLVLAVDGVPTKPYPLGGPATLAVGDRTLAVRTGDRAELAALLTAANVHDAAAAADDTDHDGLPDALDIFIGAKKTIANADAYGAGYISIKYPNGDVPREVGVCTDVIIRAMRNAGIDLQVEVHKDIKRARRAYPMVKGSGDTNIDHRRVRTILPWFTRHWSSHSTDPDDRADAWQPGDVIFMDTFPSKSGPDHIGIVSDRIGESGYPLIVNNWTDGYVTQELDLLSFVPVTHRFRVH